MDEMDELLDSLMEHRKGSEVSWVDERYADIIEVKTVPGRGEGVFAKKRLSAKNPLYSLDYPTMMAIDGEFLPTTCYHCLVITKPPLSLPSHGIASSVELKTCSGCNIVRFCGKTCQVNAWNAFHKYECKLFKKVRSDLPSGILRSVLRGILLKDRDLIAEEEWDRITSLPAHEDVLAGRGRSNLTEMAEGLKHLAATPMKVSMIQRLIFIMRSNAIELPTPIHGGIGVMLSPLFAKHNHSCEASVAVYRPLHTMKSGWMTSDELSKEQQKTFMQIIPLRDIEEGEEMMNCYVVPTEAVKVRRQKLLDGYFFECDCARCATDLQASSDLTKEHPELVNQFEGWSNSVKRHLSQVKQSPDAITKSSAAMNKSARFLNNPVLYTTGDYPILCMTSVLEGINVQAYDEALVNEFRLQFLVNPERFRVRHAPTNIYTTFMMLDIFDVLLGISPPSEANKAKVAKCLQNISSRGLSQKSLLYWRQRICADLKQRLLEQSPLKDLYDLAAKREEQGKSLAGQGSAAKEEQTKTKAEQGMQMVLGLKEPEWKRLLERNGF